MRQVVVLTEAAEDLAEARRFYDLREPGIGDYCVTRCWRTSRVWPCIMVFISGTGTVSACWRADFPLASIMWKLSRKRESWRCSTCAGARVGSGSR